MMQKYLLIVLFSLCSVCAFAQISAIAPDFTDSTKYRTVIKAENDSTEYKRESRTQDKIYVYYEKLGKLKAAQPKGNPVYFTWYKLDTATLKFNKIWADTVNIEKKINDITSSFSELTRSKSKCGNTLPLKDTTYSTDKSHTSMLPDSLGYGCYRVLTDTLQIVYDTIACDSFCYDKFLRNDTIRSFDDSRDSLVIEVRDTLYVDTTLYIATRYSIVPADTFNAWIFVDTFHVDSIAKVAQDCNYLQLQTLFYPNATDADGYYLYFAYKYFDLWQTPAKVERNCPDWYGERCANNPYCYIYDVAWTTSVDIHEGVSAEDIKNPANPDEDPEAWKKRFSPYIPTPYHSAEYKVEVTNYFGQKDTMSTGLIEAMATYAKMKLFVSKSENGATEWVEKTSEEAEKSPAVIKLVNASINTNNGDSTIWSLFSNLYEQPEDVRPEDVPLIVQFTKFDSASEVLPAKEHDPKLYEPGKYAIALYLSNRHGCFSSDTITLEVEEFLINKDAIPTVFTPNGDEKNDVFKLKDPDQNVKSLQSLEINIFNRSGQLMFSSSDVLFSWDGKMRNTNAVAPDGVYFYILKARGLNKKRETVRQTYKGYLHIFNGQ